MMKLNKRFEYGKNNGYVKETYLSNGCWVNSNGLSFCLNYNTIFSDYIYFPFGENGCYFILFKSDIQINYEDYQ